MSNKQRFNTWSEDREGFKPWLDRLRDEYGSMEKVGLALGINRFTVYDWERHPEVIQVRRLRQYLREGLITPEEIMRIIEPRGGWYV